MGQAEHSGGGTPKVHALGRRHAVATLGPVVMGLWEKTPEADSVLAYRRAAAQALVAHPAGVVFFVVAHKPGAPPDGATRAIYGQVMKEFKGKALASVLVITGASPLATSVVMGVYTGVMLLVGQGRSPPMFTSVAEGATWLCNKAAAKGVSLGAPDVLAAAVAGLQRDMTAQ